MIDVLRKYSDFECATLARVFAIYIATLSRTMFDVECANLCYQVKLICNMQFPDA